MLQKRAYKLKAWADHEDFLSQIAQSMGKLTKGGEADMNTAAKMVLLDWQRGKLPFYSVPAGYPKEPPSREEHLADQALSQPPLVTVRRPTRSCMRCC
jgi:ribosome biogenesis GTPase A